MDTKTLDEIESDLATIPVTTTKDLRRKMWITALLAHIDAEGGTRGR